jgi:uncharacterized protein YhbP (UPF0306 family)
MNNIYTIHFGIRQKAMKAYVCHVPVKTINIYTVHGLNMRKVHLVENMSKPFSKKRYFAINR